jgi:hypothetical protein
MGTRDHQTTTHLTLSLYFSDNAIPSFHFLVIHCLLHSDSTTISRMLFVPSPHIRGSQDPPLTMKRSGSPGSPQTSSCSPTVRALITAYHLTNIPHPGLSLVFQASVYDDSNFQNSSELGSRRFSQDARVRITRKAIGIPHMEVKTCVMQEGPLINKQ